MNNLDYKTLYKQLDDLKSKIENKANKIINEHENSDLSPYELLEILSTKINTDMREFEQRFVRFGQTYEYAKFGNDYSDFCIHSFNTFTKLKKSIREGCGVNQP